MNRPHFNTILSAVAVATSLILAGCASDFTNDPTRPRATRAVESPVETESGEAEVMAPPAQVVPLVVVTSGQNRNAPPQVRTLVDEIHDAVTSQPAPASTAETQPATPPRLHVDPVTGE